jgi:hypothetical protein
MPAVLFAAWKFELGGLKAVGTGRSFDSFFFFIRRKQDQMFSPFGTRAIPWLTQRKYRGIYKNKLFLREEITFEFYGFFYVTKLSYWMDVPVAWL